MYHESTHNDELKYSCPYVECSKIFSRTSRLIVHIKSAHTMEYIYECKFEGCGKVFAEKSNLRVHSRSHTGEKPYSCKHCTMRFTTIGNRKDHERRHLSLK